VIVSGFHTIEGLLRSNRKILIIHALLKERKDRLQALRKLAQQKNVEIVEYQKPKEFLEVLKRQSKGEGSEFDRSQGIFAKIPDFEYTDLQTILNQSEGQSDSVILFLDSIMDPQNLGSILRSAAFFAVNAIVIADRRAASVTATVLRVSEGGFVHVPVAQVTNMTRAIEMAKAKGYWSYALTEHGDSDFGEHKFDSPVALVVGNEEKGVRKLVLESSDFRVRLPAQGAHTTLNAAVATAVSLTMLRDRQKS